MRKQAGNVLLFLGALLLITALLFGAKNLYESYEAQKNSEAMMDEFLKGLQEDESSLEQIPMEEREVNGKKLIGAILFPSLDLGVPVLSRWDYPSLQVAPCRQWGTLKEDNLVIAGHNYPKHFGRLRELKPGDLVSFLDVRGHRVNYQVTQVEKVKPTEVEYVQESPWDLVCYTCTPGGRERVLMGANRISQK